MTILIFTSNSGKLVEFQKMLKNEISIVGLKELSELSSNYNIEPIENSDYFLTNAFIKVFVALKYIYNNKP